MAKYIRGDEVKFPQTQWAIDELLLAGWEPEVKAEAPLEEETEEKKTRTRKWKAEAENVEPSDD